MKRCTLFRSLVGAALLFLCAKTASAAVFIIANGDVAALKNAIAQSNTNKDEDTINLAANGTYTLTAADNSDADGGNGLPVMIRDFFGPSITFGLTINGNGATIQRSSAADFRIFKIDFRARVTINNLTISNGNANNPGGGGIYNNQGTFTLNNCTFSGNFTTGFNGAPGNFGHPNGFPGSTVLGGGVYSSGGSIIANRCTFSGNSAQGGAGGGPGSFGASGGSGGTGEGGGLGVANSTSTITSCAFSNNSAAGGSGGASGGGFGGGGPGGAGEGGGLGVVNSTPTITICTFSNNSATGGQGGSTAAGSFGGLGGGVSADQGTLSNCTFTGNSASSGGGIYTAGTPGVVTLTACTFTNNSAGVGGGVYNGSTLTASTTLTVNNSTLNSNTATSAFFPFDGGGGIFNNGTLTVSNCTLFGNSAHGGGGINNALSATLINCTFSSNTASSGGGVYNFNGGTMTLANSILKTGVSGGNIVNDASTLTSQGYNLSNDAAGGDSTTGPGGFLNAQGDQRNTDPQLDPAGLQNHGGPTQTIALLPGSPAIDKGKSFGLTTDQRGHGRPDDDPAVVNAVGGDGSDIGAYEASVTPAQTGPLFVVNVATDHDDGGAGACTTGDCTLREAINAANAHAGDDTITFAPVVTGTIQLTGVLPNLSTNMTVQGPGANLLSVRRDLGGDYRIFTISNGTNSGPTASISGLTIANGNALGSFPADSGGGVYNDHSTLALRYCTISGNHAGSDGGGVFNDGFGSTAPLTIQNCTFSGNSTVNNGGGLDNSVAVATITNCTFSGNNAGLGGGGIAQAGSFSGSATSTITNSTFSGNSATGAGAVANNISGSLTIANNIFASNTSVNLSNSGNPITSQGHNISSDAAGGGAGTGPGGFLNGTGDMRNTDPQLDTLGLQNNGGPTQTIALLSNSPAINAGSDANAPPRDQRDYLRVGPSDIGAFEFGGVAVRIISIAHSGNDIVVTFEATQTKSYRLERKLALTDSTWQNNFGVNDLIAASSGPAQITDPGAVSLGKAFYRVRLLP